MTRQTLFAVAAALLMLGAPLSGAVAADSHAGNAGNAALAVDVTQDDDGEVTIEVTRNETGIENATVEVETADEPATIAGPRSDFFEALDKLE